MLNRFYLDCVEFSFFIFILLSHCAKVKRQGIMSPLPDTLLLETISNVREYDFKKFQDQDRSSKVEAETIGVAKIFEGGDKTQITCNDVIEMIEKGTFCGTKIFYSRMEDQKSLPGFGT